MNVCQTHNHLYKTDQNGKWGDGKGEKQLQNKVSEENGKRKIENGITFRRFEVDVERFIGPTLTTMCVRKCALPSIDANGFANIGGQKWARMCGAEHFM